MPRHDTCALRHAADMLRFLTRGLHRHARVLPRVGRLQTTSWDPASSVWWL